MYSLTIFFFLQTQYKDWLSHILDILQATSSQAYYPVEHMAWAADEKLIKLSSDKFWTAATLLWGISLMVTFLQSVLSIVRTTCLLSNFSHTSSKKFSPESIRRKRRGAVLTLFQSLSDLINAVHWLPNGTLWSGKLSLFWVGLLGTVSSIIRLYSSQ